MVSLIDFASPLIYFENHGMLYVFPTMLMGYPKMDIWAMDNHGMLRVFRSMFVGCRNKPQYPHARACTTVRFGYLGHGQLWNAVEFLHYVDGLLQ